MYNFGDKNFDPIMWDEKLLPFEKALYLDFLKSKLEEGGATRGGQDQPPPRQEEVNF